MTPHNYLVSDLNILKNHIFVFVYVLIVVLIGNKIVDPRGTNVQWVYPLNDFVFHLKNVGDIFMFVKYCSLILVQRDNKAHWVNSLPVSKQNYVDVF